MVKIKIRCHQVSCTFANVTVLNLEIIVFRTNKNSVSSTLGHVLVLKFFFSCISLTMACEKKDVHDMPSVVCTVPPHPDKVRHIILMA